MERMNDDPVRAYQRWQAAEEGGRDEEADRAFEALFSASMPAVPVPADFETRTMHAVAAAAERDARRARHVRSAALVASVAGGAAAAYFGFGYALSVMSAVFVRLIDLVIVGVVYVVTVMQSGADAWSVAASLGRATAAAVADARVALALIVIQGVAIAAFMALRRLLHSDVEILK